MSTCVPPLGPSRWMLECVAATSSSGSACPCMASRDASWLELGRPELAGEAGVRGGGSQTSRRQMQPRVLRPKQQRPIWLNLPVKSKKTGTPWSLEFEALPGNKFKQVYSTGQGRVG